MTPWTNARLAQVAAAVAIVPVAAGIYLVAGPVASGGGGSSAAPAAPVVDAPSLPEPLLLILATPPVATTVPGFQPGRTALQSATTSPTSGSTATAAASTPAPTVTVTTSVPVPGPTTTVVSAGNPDPGTQVFARSKDAVALIELNTCTGNGVAVGTGFLISSNLLVTAGHVVADGRTPYVVLRGRRTAATVVGFDAVQDVALLRLPTALPGPYLPLSSKTPAVGQHVVTIGYPEPFALDFALSAEEGIVSGLNRTFQESQSGPPLTGLLQTDIPAWFGNSGGPVITYAGDVVGLIHGVVADPDGHGGLTPTPVQLSIGAATAARDVNGWASRTAAIRFC